MDGVMVSNGRLSLRLTSRYEVDSGEVVPLLTECDLENRSHERTQWGLVFSMQGAGFRDEFMSFTSKVCAGVLTSALCLAGPAYGQGRPASSEPPETVPFRLGPVALAPTLTLTNFGWDSNVFQQQAAAGPVGDVTATGVPEIQSWVRVGRARVSTHSTFAYFYFQQYASERSLDQEHEARVELRMGRLTPYIAGDWVKARQRFGFEIDQRIGRQQKAALAGLEFRLGPRTKIDASATRGRWEFDSSDEFSDPFADQLYDYTSEGFTVVVSRDLTPFTSLAAGIDKHQDRFDNDPGRDSNSESVTAGLEFKPLAMIHGSAYVGWHRLYRVTPGSGEFSGPVAEADLAYTLFGATRFAVQIHRDITYSALRSQHAYLLTGVRAAVNHHLAGNWEVGARIGRYRQSYGLFDSTTSDNASGQFNAGREIITEYSGEVAYWFSRKIRMAFGFNREQRGSSFGAPRDYERTRSGLSLQYRF